MESVKKVIQKVVKPVLVPISIIGAKKAGQSWSSYWTQLLESPNSDLVQWNSIDNVATTGAYLTAPSNGDAIIVIYKGERITGYREISQISFYNETITNIASIEFFVWRFTDPQYERVYYEDIIAKITNGAGIKTITLASAVSVMEGDFVGMRWRSTVGTIDINYATAAAANSIRYYIGTTAPGNPFNWNIQVGIAYKTQIHVFGQSPIIVGIGDSMMESYPLHTSMPDVTRTTVDVTKSWMYKMYAADNRFIYQDCGIGNEQTTDIEARFNRDVVLKKPKLAVINGGVNDIANSVSKATFLAKWTSIFDMCVAGEIIPIVWKIMPCNNLDNTEMATRDEWNADLEALFNSYTFTRGAKIIDWDSILGVNRVGGAAGNLWDVNPTYAQGDGTHLNEAGQALIASTVLALFS